MGSVRQDKYCLLEEKHILSILKALIGEKN